MVTWPSSKWIRGVRRVAWIALWAAGVAACGGGAATPPTSDDREVLLGVVDALFACAPEAMERVGFALAREDAATRVAQSDWVEDDEGRLRATYYVRVHERMGPGVDVVVNRERADDAGGWREAETLPGDQQVARRIVGAAVRCWEGSDSAAQAR